MEGWRIRNLGDLTIVTVTKAGLDRGTLSGMKDVSGWVVFLRGSRLVEGALGSPGTALQGRDQDWGSGPSSFPPCCVISTAQGPHFFTSKKRRLDYLVIGNPFPT